MIAPRPCVLDASAVLALFEREPGWQQVAARLKGAAISAVNWSEIVQKNLDRGTPLDTSRSWAASNGIEVVEFARQDAELAAALERRTRAAGLSLGDRACLALAQRMRRTALTADGRWAHLKLAPPVEFIR